MELAQRGLAGAGDEEEEGEEGFTNVELLALREDLGVGNHGGRLATGKLESWESKGERAEQPGKSHKGILPSPQEKNKENPSSL